MHPPFPSLLISLKVIHLYNTTVKEFVLPHTAKTLDRKLEKTEVSTECSNEPNKNGPNDETKWTLAARILWM